MKELRTTFYEIRGYFVPGSMVLWAILELIGMTGYLPTTEAISTLPPSARGVLLLAIAYVIGHGLHAIANYTIDKMPFGSYPPKNYFEEKFDKDFPPEAVSSLFNATVVLLAIPNPDTANVKETIKKSYWVCFQYVMNLHNVETENFLGLTGFYRGITSAMVVISVLYFVAFLFYCQARLGIISASCFLLALLFLTRVRRFGYYLAKNVYSNFLHLYTEKIQGDPHP